MRFHLHCGSALIPRPHRSTSPFATQFDTFAGASSLLPPYRQRAAPAKAPAKTAHPPFVLLPSFPLISTLPSGAAPYRDNRANNRRDRDRDRNRDNFRRSGGDRAYSGSFFFWGCCEPFCVLSLPNVSRCAVASHCLRVQIHDLSITLPYSLSLLRASRHNPCSVKAKKKKYPSQTGPTQGPPPAGTPLPGHRKPTRTGFQSRPFPFHVTCLLQFFPPFFPSEDFL